MSLLRRRAQPVSSDMPRALDAGPRGIAELIAPLRRIGFENWELGLALHVVELWVKVRPGIGFGPLGRDFAEAPPSDRAAAHDLFVREGLLFLHSCELETEFLIVKTHGGSAPDESIRTLYRAYYGHGDGSYRPLHAYETLKEMLMEVWALQQDRAPLPKLALVR